jgi:hypothetical protein
MIYEIIVRILCDARMVAPGVVFERGDRVCGHRIRRSFSPLALNEVGAADYLVRWLPGDPGDRHHVHLPWLSGRIPSKSPCPGVFLRAAASFLPGRVEKKTDDTLSKIVVSAVNAEVV